jgi:hypothetical protein
MPFRPTALTFCLLAALAVGGAARGADPTGHWAFQPMADPVPPGIPGTNHLRSPVDAFIRASLQEAGLSPSAPAHRRTLLRRLSFDLLGLPPSPGEVEAFVQDPDPDAFARQVDRYLASPRYGERWGRWWLDLARYADTNGQDENKVMANAWRYRDWVIRSFNANQPFNLFITDQLAGDLLPTNDVPEETVFDRWTATGLLVLGPKMLAEQDKPKLVMDLVDEQIDVVTRAFLGLTVGCARCHDHKFDPVSARDYYAMAGIFKSTRTMENLDFVSKFNERPVSTRAHLAALETHGREMKARNADLARTVESANDALRRQWRDELASLLADGMPDRATPEASSATDPGTPPLRKRFAALSALNPATHSLARTLRSLQGQRDQASALLQDLSKETTPAAGLRIGPGRVGGAFLANGSNHLDLSHAAALDPASITVEAWVKSAEFPGGGDARRWLVNKNSNEWVQGHYALMLDRDRPGAYLNIGGGKANVFALWSDGPRLQTNRWHHLAFTYDGTRLRLFVDGQPAGETRIERPRVAGSSPVTLGRRQDGYSYFRGGLDEVRLYDRALDPAEVSAHAADPGSPEGPGVVARWDFNTLTDAEQEALRLAELREAVYGAEGLLALPSDPRPWYPAETREDLIRRERERDALAAAAPPPPAHALAVAEETTVDLPVMVRGSHLNPGKDPVPRGFIQVVNRNPTPSPPVDRSGRLELARWLTEPEHPLTARVVVNRVWQAHFGEGLVRTPDNFGIRGEPPTHPALLDWLARELIRSGWDLKHLHRLLLNSATWQQASVAEEPGGAAPESSVARSWALDPDNRFLARFPRQRLEAEMVRDALLAVSRRLDATTGGTLVAWKNDDYAPGDEVSESSVRRSVYLPVVRDRVYDVFTLFDFANPSVGTAKRTPTVVSHQALFFLNSPLVRDSAQALADSLCAEAGEHSARIQLAYERLFSRPPHASEITRARRFLERAAVSATGEPERTSWAALCQSLLAANEFLYRE